jgi:hypothetical protein
MALIGTMVAGIAHELNNPINFVYANMPILEGYLTDLKELILKVINLQLSRIEIHSQLTSQHEHVLLGYLHSTRNLPPAQWLILFEAVEHLGLSTLVIDATAYTFRQFYNQFIDAQFADTFIGQLVQLTELKEATVLQASIARQIVAFLQGLSGFSLQQKACRLFMVYCLYWWGAFARGYIFEQEIFEDLAESGIEYVPHDITDRQGRFSPYDLVIAGLRGDVKYTTYFLAQDGLPGFRADFFITRAYDTLKREWRKVVAIRHEVWQNFNGETTPSSREGFVSILPQAASITVQNEQLIVVEYDDWKNRIRRHIQSRRKSK